MISGQGTAIHNKYYICGKILQNDNMLTKRQTIWQITGYQSLKNKEKYIHAQIYWSNFNLSNCAKKLEELWPAYA